MMTPSNVSRRLPPGPVHRTATHPAVSRTLCTRTRSLSINRQFASNVVASRWHPPRTRYHLSGYRQPSTRRTVTWCTGLARENHFNERHRLVVTAKLLSEPSVHPYSRVPSIVRRQVEHPLHAFGRTSRAMLPKLPDAQRPRNLIQLQSWISSQRRPSLATRRRIPFSLWSRNSAPSSPPKALAVRTRPPIFPVRSNIVTLRVRGRW